jgi:hypothetical protein
MSNRRSTSSNHKQINQNSCSKQLYDPNHQATAEENKEGYSALVNKDHHHDDSHKNTTVLNFHSLPPTHGNNLKSIDSPLRRPHSATDDDISELDDFEQDPATKLILNNRKKTKTNNNNLNKQNDVYKTRNALTAEQSYLLQQQQQNNITAPALVNHKFNTNPVNSITLTNEAKRFAQTRYPFSPFIIRFPSTHIKEQKVSEELCKHLNLHKQLDLELSGYRKSTAKSSANECDILLFVKNSQSFSILNDETNWPALLLGLNYTRPSTPPIPPQLSLIIKNVGLSVDFENFTHELKTTYSNLQSVIRMKNKSQMNIKLVKLEFSKPNQRDEILDRGKIFVNSLTFDVDEYLAPARVLICSKCMGIGHFRGQCQQKEETCKKCGIPNADIKDHVKECFQLRCIHCQGNHMSNDMRCPKVKQYRTDLTRYLLSPAIQANPVVTNGYPAANDFPPLNPSQRTTIFRPLLYNKNVNNSNNVNDNNNMINNNLLSKLDEINDKLDKLTNKYNRIESCIEDIKKSNDEIKTKINDLTLDNSHIKNGLNNHERIIKDILIPIAKHLISFTKEINMVQGRWKNADFGSQIEIYLQQLNSINETKNLLQ